jgi:hypothetical protein
MTGHRRSPLFRIRGLFSFLAGIGFLSGCSTEFRAVTPTQLRQIVDGVQGAGSDLWRGTFYCGSDGEFDYFRQRRALSRDIRLKVRKGEIALPKTTIFPANPSDWVEVSQLLENNLPAGAGED